MTPTPKCGAERLFLRGIPPGADRIESLQVTLRKERVKFVLEWEKHWEAGEERLNFSELCREFGLSRPVGCDRKGESNEP